jgi:hypothetical protein
MQVQNKISSIRAILFLDDPNPYQINSLFCMASSLHQTLLSNLCSTNINLKKNRFWSHWKMGMRRPSHACMGIRCPSIISLSLMAKPTRALHPTTSSTHASLPSPYSQTLHQSLHYLFLFPMTINGIGTMKCLLQSSPSLHPVPARTTWTHTTPRHHGSTSSRP